MRKQVTFVEEKSRDRLQHVESRVTRSAAHYCTHGGHHMGSRSLYHDGCSIIKTQKLAPLKPQPKPTSETHQIPTIHIPKSMLTAPFLQHPSLTPGQKCYLYSIANVYSTQHMRALMRRQYLNVLHRCTRAGQNSLRQNRTLGSNIQNKQKHLDTNSRKNSVTSTRKTANRHRTAGDSGRLDLPRINQTRMPSSTSTSTERQARKIKVHIEGNTSVQSTDKCSDFSEKQKMEDEEFLSENMSSLSVKGNEETLAEV